MSDAARIAKSSRFRRINVDGILVARELCEPAHELVANDEPLHVTLTDGHTHRVWYPKGSWWRHIKESGVGATLGEDDLD